MHMCLLIVLMCLVSVCAHRKIESVELLSMEGDHAWTRCNKDDLGVEVSKQCTTFTERTGLGTEWVAPLSCVAKSFRVTNRMAGCVVRNYMYKYRCEKVIQNAGLKLADERDIELDTLRQNGTEFVIGDGLHAVVYWTSESTTLFTNSIDVGAIIAFRWQNENTIDNEQAFHWFAKPGSRFFAGIWLPNVIAQVVAGGKDHKWASSAADLVKAVQAVQPNKRIAFTGFSVGAVCAQLMSILHSQGGLVHPAVVFGGNGVRHVLGLEGGSGPFTSLSGAHLKTTKRSFHPYIYNFIDPGDSVPRIDCQLGAVCVMPESVAGSQCTETIDGVNVTAKRTKSADCTQCKTHVAFMFENKFLDAFLTRGASAFNCVAGHEWRGALKNCFQKDPPIVSFG